MVSFFNDRGGNKFERTIALNAAADALGFDPDARKAMTHVETLIGIMSKAELTWNDIPGRFSLEKALGEVTIQALCEQDPGLALTVRSQHDPELRTSLLARYVQCIEVAKPGEVMTVQQALINCESD